MTTQEEAHQLVREAIADSYDALHLIEQGKLTAERWEVAARGHLERIVANASMETHSAWHDGDAVALAGEDFQLAQLAHSYGGTTELHALLAGARTRDQLLAAINANESEGFSTAAANRDRSAALREFQAARDAAYVEHGLLTQEAADEREMGRIREERREQGLDLVGELEPAELDELERTQVEAEPQYDRPPRDEFEAAERGDMESYMEFSRRRDRREQEAEKAAARVRRLQNAGY